MLLAAEGSQNKDIARELSVGRVQVARWRECYAEAGLAGIERDLQRGAPPVKVAFYDFPAQHWQRVRTSNPIESTFGTIRHRTKRSRGCLTHHGMLHMMFKLGQCAEKNWRRLRGFDYLAKVITGIKFRDGIEVTNVNQATALFNRLNTTFDNNFFHIHHLTLPYGCFVIYDVHYYIL